MSTLPACPKCNSEYTYEDGELFICPECAYEWQKNAMDASTDDVLIVRDANGNILVDGDNVTVVKDLKIKGTSSVIKVGTKAKIVRIVEGDHDLDCKVDGMGAMMLKSSVVKKA
jgi:protein PhnA